jgi:hypothetical protein
MYKTIKKYIYSILEQKRISIAEIYILKRYTRKQTTIGK